MHYNAADLPMLSDFNILKEKLSIVAKSFVTLGLPLRHDESFIYIRDTYLLVPGTKRRLKDIAKLYKDEGFSKKELEYKDIIKMSRLLERDKESFIDYAITDAKITLKYAIEMEKLNKIVKQLGIPLTLYSIAIFHRDKLRC